ncbi:fatty acid desaturase [Sulfitobacter sp. 1151]|uniref:Fatty acid desaturase n=2 Tax=Parasulfitobacter algicola TaxID=2614809 RepID=A0ABX2ITA0_9RHOB|nr:fatty acid desaturase [Sulfitobacter algicola]
MTIREFTRKYCQRSNKMALLSYFGNLIVYFFTFWLALQAIAYWWLVIPIVIVNSFAAVRLYVLQHDCGHASLFETKRLNDMAGYAVSIFTLTPYYAMQCNHNAHHTHIGNLDERDSGEIYTMTLREYQTAPLWKRAFYRLYRNPLLMLPIGGFFAFAIRNRWPKNTLKIGVWGVLVHNLAVMIWLGIIYAIFGWAGLIVYAGTVLCSGIIGVFMVYLQHNFEDTYWDRKPDLRFEAAALKGASTLDLGWWFDIATANISYHDIHHYNARIPSYNLRRCHHDMREVFDMQVIRWPQAIRNFSLKLWDEDQKRLVRFPGPKQSISTSVSAKP